MELITKNKLQAIIGQWYNHKHYETFKWPTSISLTDLAELIESTPSIDAIPIDKPFLKMRYGDYVVYNKKWLVNHLQTEWNILQGKEYQPSIPTDWIKKYASMKRTNDEMDCYWHFWEEDVLKMVDEWEKENETGNSNRTY